MQRAPPASFQQFFGFLPRAIFCYKLFSRGWVILTKYWVSARLPLVSWRAATNGSDATKPVVQTLPDLCSCVDAADVSYVSDQ